MKRIDLAVAVVLMCCTGAAAQNGVYTVTNTSELTVRQVAKGLQRNAFTLTSEDTEAEHSGQRPQEVDTAGVLEIVSLWLAEQVSAEELRGLTGAVPSQVQVGEEGIVLAGASGDTAGVYPVVRRERREGEREEWLFECAGGQKIVLRKRAGGEWEMVTPEGTSLMLRKRE